MAASSDPHSPTPPTRLVAGVMTGTSLDGLDAVAADITGTGLDLRATLRSHAAMDLGPAAADLRRAADGEALTARQLATAGRALAERHVEVIQALGPIGRYDLVAVHGQTITHHPPVSWQLINAAPIAARLGCPVVTDLRQADLAAGGQGAPITPLADWILFRGDERRAVVNLGGFCNVTILPAAGAPDDLDAIDGFDVCACNHVLDAVAREALGVPYDDGGRAAGAGRADPVATDDLAGRLDAQRRDGRSLGSGDETRSWVERHAGRLDGPDLAASAVTAIGAVIAAALAPHDVARVLLAGGGARNAGLAAALGAACDRPVATTAELGVPVESREALAIAVLGALCFDGVPITLPRVTGCRAPVPVAGTWSGLWMPLASLLDSASGQGRPSA